MNDGGGENIGLELKKIYIEKNIKRLIAKQDISFTNSIVESFFYILKNNLFDKRKLYSLPKLYNLIRRSIITYNNMPLPIFNGATALEIYESLISSELLKDDFLVKQKIAHKHRLKENQLCLSKQSC